MQYLKEQVRERILQSAREEFIAHGFSNASIRNIADGSGTSLGNIYRYFTDKEALYIAVIEGFVHNSAEFSKKEFDLSDETLRKYPALFLSFIETNKEDLTILCNGPKEHFANYLKQTTDIYTDKLCGYIALNCSSAANVLNKNFCRNVCMCFISGIVRLLFKEEAENLEKELEELVWFFFGDVKRRVRNYVQEASL